MKFIKASLQSNPLLFIIFIFLIWRTLLFLTAKITIDYLPLQQNFLGGGMQNYLANPLVWGYANFDGEHFLAIARNGYEPLTYFFFPVYPMLIGFIANVLGNNFYNFLLSSLLISNISFLAALIGLYKLLKIDYAGKTVLLTILLLLVFPTSFYFASVYNESLFFALVVWSFYFLRKKHWLFAGLLALVASATRVIGIIMFLVILVEVYEDYKQNKNFNLYAILSSFLAPLGLIIYMVYMQQKTGDFLEFLHSVEIYGQQRSSKLILLPQVFYRYIFKVIPAVGFNYFPSTVITLLEFLTGVWLLFSSAFAFIKLRLSYAVFLVLGFLVPTLSGSFSSLPRYAIVLFPAFLLLALFISSFSKYIKMLLLLVMSLLLVATQMLFLRGYWVS